MSISGLLFVFASSFMTMFPVSDPVGNSFIINNFLTGVNKEERRKAINKIVVYFVLIGLGVLMIGHLLLLLFGLAVPVIQLGGGFLIAKTGLGLLSQDDSDNGTENDVENTTDIPDSPKWKELQKKIFYPISFPITIGPGTISVIFTLMASSTVKDNFLETILNYFIVCLAIVCIAIVLYVSLVQGVRITQKLGGTGMLIINKLVAFFTFCIGLQIMVLGISKIFHIHVL